MLEVFFSCFLPFFFFLVFYTKKIDPRAESVIKNIGPQKQPPFQGLCTLVWKVFFLFFPSKKRKTTKMNFLASQPNQTINTFIIKKKPQGLTSSVTYNEALNVLTQLIPISPNEATHGDQYFVFLLTGFCTHFCMEALRLIRESGCFDPFPLSDISRLV